MSRVEIFYGEDNLLVNDLYSVNHIHNVPRKLFSLQLVNYVSQPKFGRINKLKLLHSSLPNQTAGISDMTRKSLALIRCIISGEDEDEDPQQQQQQLKSVEQVYDMIT